MGAVAETLPNDGERARRHVPSFVNWILSLGCVSDAWS